MESLKNLDWKIIKEISQLIISTLIALPVAILAIINIVDKCKQSKISQNTENSDLTPAVEELKELINIFDLTILVIQKSKSYVPKTLIRGVEENFVKRKTELEDELRKIQQRIGQSKEAAKWLNNNKIKELAENAYQKALHEYTNTEIEDSKKKKVKEFKGDIGSYLVLIRRCLESGRANVLDHHETVYYQSLPTRFYVDALSDMVDKEIPPQGLSVDAFREFEYHIKQLIKRINTKFLSKSAL